jgi:toxin ParE1/3/4
MLADNADLGRSCDEICSGGFYFPVAKHMAYYIKENDFILIVAVLGQAQISRDHLY